MSQAALCSVVGFFRILNVDSLKEIYDVSTVQLAPNDTETSTITFDTEVAVGSITSPQLFDIFINALLRMLTNTRQIHGISHGLQIGKELEGSSKDAERGYQSSGKVLL